MIVQLKNFGEILTSRQAGHEAFLAARAYILPAGDEEIVIDFEGVKVLAPSWAAEFLEGVNAQFPNKVRYINDENPSVRAVLKMLDEISIRS